MTRQAVPHVVLTVLCLAFGVVLVGPVVTAVAGVVSLAAVAVVEWRRRGRR